MKKISSFVVFSAGVLSILTIGILIGLYGEDSGSTEIADSARYSGFDTNDITIGRSYTVIALLDDESGSSEKTNSTRYPGCDTDDITIGSYTIAACNVGATTASTDWTVSRGKYFQWGRNKGFAYSDSSQQSTIIDGNVGLDASTDTFGFVSSTSLSKPYTWAYTGITNNWGYATSTNTAGQGPCAPGYRVPSQSDWQGIIASGGWETSESVMQSVLQLPYAGYRSWFNGVWASGGSAGYYWSSSPTGSDAYSLYFGLGDISPSDVNGRAFGFSVRCFKN